MKDKTDENNLPKDVKVMPSILDAFDLLKAPKDDAKVIGSAKIISQLLGSENDKSVQYALRRLIRSLGANVPELRIGYFATLVSLLSKFDNVTIPQLLQLVKTELHANGSCKSEIGDISLGQILVCSAIFRSGLILKSNGEEQTQVVQLLMGASKKKSYLSTVAYLILLDFAKGLNEDQFSSIVWSNIKQDLKKDIKEHSLDSLYFLMVVSDKFPEKVKLQKLLGVTEILCEDNIHAICEKILSGVDFNSLGHPIYKEIGIRIADSKNLQLFWTSGIDSQLTKHNRNRELVAINILTTILNNINHNAEVIPELISRNFFKLFLDWFKGLQTASKIRSKRDNEDDSKIMIKKQKELLNSLGKALKGDMVTPKVRLEVLKKLLLNPGEINFTEVTGTAIVKAAISDLDKDGVKKMAKLLKGVLLNTSKKFIKDDVERSWYNNERIKGAELLSYLVSHETVKDDTDFKLTYMKLLMCFGFFKIGGDDNVTISTDLSGAIKSSFYRCFTSRFSNVDNLVTVLSSLCNFICTILEKEQVRIKIEKQFPSENMECWTMLMEVCQKIEKNESKSKVDNVFLILLYQLGLFLFSEPTHVKIARNSIKELKSCYEHYRKGKKKKPKASNKDNLVIEEPEWIEVLVEVLLSILSAESSVLRLVVQCVFRLLWEYLTPTALNQILSVLDPESESNPLTHDDDSDEGSDIEDEVNGDENDENKSNTTSDNDDDQDNYDEDSDKDEDGDIKIPDQLRLAVQKALGTATNESDVESLDADMIDEEEGKKLDEALADAFKQFHQSKGKKSKSDRKDKKALSDFRIRVLDLIDIYLEKDPSMDICLGMIAPLTRCLEFCVLDSQFSELENRVRKTIKILTKIRKFTSTDDVTMDMLCEYLKSSISKGERSHFLFQAIGDIVTYFATFIIHCAQKLEAKTIKSQSVRSDLSIIEIFKETVKSYFLNRNCLLPIIFFHNILQTDWEGTYELVPIIIEHVFNNDVRQFRRNEGIELIVGFYRSLKRNKPTSDKALKKLINIETQFKNALTNTIQQNSELAVKKNFFILLKKLINTMKVFHENCNVDTKLDFKLLLDDVTVCKSTVKVISNKVIENQNKQSKNKSKTKKRKTDLTNGYIEPSLKRIRTDSSESD